MAAGLVRRMSADEAASAPCVSPAFVNWDRPNKPKLVVDLRQVNAHVQVIKFKHEAQAEFMSSLLPADHLVSCDINDANHHVFIHPSDRPNLIFTVGDHTYEAITMAFWALGGPVRMDQDKETRPCCSSGVALSAHWLRGRPWCGRAEPTFGVQVRCGSGFLSGDAAVR